MTPFNGSSVALLSFFCVFLLYPKIFVQFYLYLLFFSPFFWYPTQKLYFRLTELSLFERGRSPEAVLSGKVVAMGKISEKTLDFL